jgi:hypothetical protein
VTFMTNYLSAEVAGGQFSAPLRPLRGLIGPLISLLAHLALQLHFSVEMRLSCGCLVSASKCGPGKDMGG